MKSGGANLMKAAVIAGGINGLCCACLNFIFKDYRFNDNY